MLVLFTVPFLAMAYSSEGTGIRLVEKLTKQLFDEVDVVFIHCHRRVRMRSPCSFDHVLVKRRVFFVSLEVFDVDDIVVASAFFVNSDDLFQLAKVFLETTREEEELGDKLKLRQH